MADTIFCLDIADDAVTGVLVDRSSKATVVIGCGHAELRGMPLHDGVVQVCQQAGFTGGACRLSLGIDFFSIRNLPLPFSDQKKISQILPFELENISAAETGTSLVDFLISGTDPEGTRIVSASIEKESLTILLSTLENMGIDPETVEIRGVRIAVRIADALAEDCVFLDVCAVRTGLIVVSKGRVALIRSLPFDPTTGGGKRQVGELGVLVRRTLFASQIVDLDRKNFTICLIGDESGQQEVATQLASQLGVKVKSYRLDEQPLIKIDSAVNQVYRPLQMDSVFALALKSKAKSGIFNFRKDEFKKKKSMPELRAILLKVGVPVALSLVALIMYIGYDYKMLRDKQQSLQQQVVQVFSETLPEVKRIVNPAQQLQVRINEIRKTYSGGEGGTGYSVLSLLTEISARIPKSYPVVVKRLVADSDTVRIKAVTRDFNTVDNVQKELEKSPYFEAVTISSANQSPEGDEVRFELKLELK